MIGYDGKKVSAQGKGSKPRHADNKAYKKNYDLIDWGHDSAPEELDGDDAGSDCCNNSCKRLKHRNRDKN